MVGMTAPAPSTKGCIRISSANAVVNWFATIGPRVEESLHFAAVRVNLRADRRKFQLKSGGDRRMVLTSAGRRGPCGVGSSIQRDVPPCSCGSGRLPGTCCCFEPAHVRTRGRVVGSLQPKEIGYGQQ